MDRNYDVITLFQLLFILRRSRVDIFADIIKLVTMFIKTIFKGTKKLKELEMTYQNAICICISWYCKIC